ncbi:DnaJ domain-containing protein [Novispirillum itersonii]|uniref:J domain-containing protein n=1 Tax=Novispirillum itersonii TaxID=189 RepID=A0A7X0DK79_NOVIT|nr:hypothetical protein [Novispirillum itersonii]
MSGGRFDIDPADPRGFYAMLKVAPTASPAEIKSAFRRRAKDLHPDRNPDPGAKEAFHRLTAAYEVLSDPARRAAYDSRRTGAAGKQGTGQGTGQERPSSRHTASSGSRSGPQARQPQGNDPTRAYRQTQARTQQRPTAQRPPPGRAAAPPLSCCCCGKVAAQPRFVEFVTVTGTLRHTREQWTDGVYCRACADRTALKVAARCWLTGWWSPGGPLKTLRALGIALRGGRLPRQKNHALLMQQAQAFLAQRDPMMAHAVALQAQMFAPDGVSRLQTDQLLAQIRAAAPGKTLPPLKDRWRGASLLQLLQLLPVYVLIVVLALLFWPGRQAADDDIDPPPATVAPVSAPAAPAPSGTAGSPAGAVPARPGGPQSVPSATTPAPSPAAPPPIVSLSAGGVRAGQYHDIRVAATALRTGPGQEFQTLLLLGAGETVMVTEVASDGQWARVQTLDGRPGFISSRALSLTDPARAEALRREQKRTGRP